MKQLKQRLVKTLKQFENMCLSEYNLIAKSYADIWGHGNGLVEKTIRDDFIQCIKENPDVFGSVQTTCNNKKCFYWKGMPYRDWDKDLFRFVMENSLVKPQLVSASGKRFLVLLENNMGDIFHISEAPIRLFASGRYLPEQYPLAAVVRTVGASIRGEIDYRPFAYLNPGKNDGMIVKISALDRKETLLLDDYEWIYIFKNPAMPGLYKIGRTNDPERRLKELSAETSAPENFQFFYLRPVANAKKMESEIHSLLSEYRPNKKKEWFRIDPMEAVRKIEEFFQRR